MVASVSKVFSKGVQEAHGARQAVSGPHRSGDNALSSGENVRSEQARGGGIPDPRCLIATRGNDAGHPIPTHLAAFVVPQPRT